MGGAVRHRKGMPKRKPNRPTQRTPRRATAAARGAEPQGRLATALAVYNPDMLAACTEVGAIDYRLAVDLAPSWYRGTVTGRKLADFDPIEQVSLIAVIRALDDPVTGNLVHAHTDALADYLDQLAELPAILAEWADIDVGRVREIRGAQAMQAVGFAAELYDFLAADDFGPGRNPHAYLGNWLGQRAALTAARATSVAVELLDPQL